MNLLNSYFAGEVENDVTQFIQDTRQNRVLIFPPVNSYHRFTIHQIVQQQFHLLSTFSIGRGSSRRTVVCYKSSLISNPKLNGDSSSDSSIQSENPLTSKMGVEESSSSITKSPNNSRHKQAKSCVEIYRPPAARQSKNNPSPTLTTNDESSMSTRSKQRRPDRAVYVPKARRSTELHENVYLHDNNIPKKLENKTQIKSSNKDNDDIFNGKSDEMINSSSSQVVDENLLDNIVPVNVSVDNKIDELNKDKVDDKIVNIEKENEEENHLMNGMSSKESLNDEKTEEVINENKVRNLVSDVLIISYQEDHKENVDVDSVKDNDINLKPIKPVEKKVKKIARPKSKPASPPPPSIPYKINRNECDWDSLFDDNGECLDPTLIEELTAAVGEVTIEQPKNDYKTYTKSLEVSTDEFAHVVEIYNFPSDFKTSDLASVFSPFKNGGFELKWVDDTHCLGVFSSPLVAAEVLASNHSFVKTRPLSEATALSRMKAKKSAEFLQPYKSRPETCAALARRLVTGALGVRLATARQEREHEKIVLREAKERKRLANKQREDIWEGIIAQK